MLELQPLLAGVVRVCAEPAALEDEARRHQGGLLPIAGDEALVLCAPSEEIALADRIGARLAASAPSSLVVADGDSFAAWCLLGPATDDALARLCDLAPPRRRPAFLQGLVAQLPTKLLVEERRALLLVPSSAGHHLQARVLAACAALDVHVAQAASLDPTSWLRVAA